MAEKFLPTTPATQAMWQYESRWGRRHWWQFWRPRLPKLVYLDSKPADEELEHRYG